MGLRKHRCSTQLPVECWAKWYVINGDTHAFWVWWYLDSPPPPLRHTSRNPTRKTKLPVSQRWIRSNPTSIIFHRDLQWGVLLLKHLRCEIRTPDTFGTEERKRSSSDKGWGCQSVPPLSLSLSVKLRSFYLVTIVVGKLTVASKPDLWLLGLFCQPDTLAGKRQKLYYSKILFAR